MNNTVTFTDQHGHTLHVERFPNAPDAAEWFGALDGPGCTDLPDGWHNAILETENGHTATIANYDPLPLPAGDRPMTTYPARPDHMAAWIAPDVTESPNTAQLITMHYDPADDAVTVTLSSRAEPMPPGYWSLPVDTHAIRFVDALPTLQPLFDRIRTGYTPSGKLTDDGLAAVIAIAEWIDTDAPRIPGDNAGVWYAADWYDLLPEITADTTDEEIAAIAEREDTYYLDEFGAVIIDTYDYLIDYRDRLAEETDQ
jgi:hypothetical protein